MSIPDFLWIEEHDPHSCLVTVVIQTQDIISTHAYTPRQPVYIYIPIMSNYFLSCTLTVHLLWVIISQLYTYSTPIMSNYFLNCTLTVHVLWVITFSVVHLQYTYYE